MTPFIVKRFEKYSDWFIWPLDIQYKGTQHNDTILDDIFEDQY